MFSLGFQYRLYRGHRINHNEQYVIEISWFDDLNQMNSVFANEFAKMSENQQINPLLRNVVKWSDTLKKACSIRCKIFKMCLTILQHCEVKG